MHLPQLPLMELVKVALQFVERPKASPRAHRANEPSKLFAFFQTGCDRAKVMECLGVSHIIKHCLDRSHQPEGRTWPSGRCAFASLAKAPTQVWRHWHMLSSQQPVEPSKKISILPR